MRLPKKNLPWFDVSLYFQIIRKKKTGWFFVLVRSLLYLASLVYGGMMRLRNYLYDHHYLTSAVVPDCVVISIGNLVLGGVGKTPAVHLVAREFYQKYPLAIVLRGYQSPAEHAPQPLSMKGNTSTDLGDEAQIHAKEFPESWVIANRHRVNAASMASRKGAKLIILDDAMQHRKIFRHFNVVVMDGRDLFGEGYVFPRGLLRESPKGLKRADLILINHSSGSDWQAIRQAILSYSTAPCLFTQLQVKGIVPYLPGPVLQSFHHEKIGVFCAIGNSDSFFDTVRSLDGEIVAVLTAKDHESFSKESLHAFAARCRQAGAVRLVCTEKDLVKLGADLRLPIPLYWVKVDMVIVDGHQEWETFARKIDRHLSLKYST